jgi:hypothetical protein
MISKETVTRKSECCLRVPSPVASTKTKDDSDRYLGSLCRMTFRPTRQTMLTVVEKGADLSI